MVKFKIIQDHYLAKILHGFVYDIAENDIQLLSQSSRRLVVTFRVGISFHLDHSVNYQCLKTVF